MLDPMNNYHLVQAVMKEREEAAKQRRLINEALAARSGRPPPQYLFRKWLRKLRIYFQRPSCEKSQTVVCC